MARLIPAARNRVRLVVPTADRVIEVVVAFQRHAAPARLVVRYVITHYYCRRRGSNLRSTRMRLLKSISNVYRNTII